MIPTNFQEGSPIKELLKMLFQLLSLKTGGKLSPEGSEDTAFIAAEIFKKPFAFGSPSEGFHHTVCLLPTLKNVQSKISGWIEVLSSHPDPTVKNSASNDKTAKETPASNFPKGREGFSFDLTSQASKPELLAQKLVGEVRVAIQTLSVSSFLSNPQPGPLRDALSRLKPLVDELIEALSKNNLDPHQEGSFTPFKHQANFQKFQEEGKKERIPLSFFQKSNSDKQQSVSRKSGPHVFSKSESFISDRQHFLSHDDPDFSSNPESFSQEQSLKTPRKAPLLFPKEESRNPQKSSIKEGVDQNSISKPNLPLPETITKMEISENSKDASAVNPSFPKNEAQGNHPILQGVLSSSHLISNAEEETGQKAPDRIPLPICLPNPASGTLLRPLASAKKKKQRRYFFKEDLSEDNSDDSRE